MKTVEIETFLKVNTKKLRKHIKLQKIKPKFKQEPKISKQKLIQNIIFTLKLKLNKLKYK